MAAPHVFKDARIYFGGYDISGYCNNVGLNCSMEELDNSRFGDKSKVFYPGVMASDVQLQGFFKAGAGEVDNISNTALPGKLIWPLTIAPIGDSSGGVAYTYQAAQFGWQFGGAHGVALPFTLTTKNARLTNGGELVRETILLPKATVTSTTTGTGRQLGALAATQKLSVCLHVFAEVGGGTWTLTIESDDNSGFTSATTRLTFTGATGITREVKELNGAITDDYWRAVLTKVGGTSCTAMCAAGITNISV